MGLSIHYKGILQAPTLIQPLAEEAAAIAELLEWPFIHLPLKDAKATGRGGSEPDKADTDNIQGIVLNPPGSEPLVLCFKPDGRLVMPFYETDHEDWISTKTQYAGIDAHMVIIRLFRYLSEKYFAKFELEDEGRYWETGDEEELRIIWARYEAAIAAVVAALDAFPAKESESHDSLIDRLEAFLKQQLRS